MVLWPGNRTNLSLSLSPSILKPFHTTTISAQCNGFLAFILAPKCLLSTQQTKMQIRPVNSPTYS